MEDAVVLLCEIIGLFASGVLAGEEVVNLFGENEVDGASWGAEEDEDCGFLGIIVEQSSDFEGEEAAFTVAEDAETGGINLRLLAKEAVSGGGVAGEILPGEESGPCGVIFGQSGGVGVHAALIEAEGDDAVSCEVGGDLLEEVGDEGWGLVSVAVSGSAAGEEEEGGMG